MKDAQILIQHFRDGVKSRLILSEDAYIPCPLDRDREG